MNFSALLPESLLRLTVAALRGSQLLLLKQALSQSGLVDWRLLD